MKAKEKKICFHCGNPFRNRKLREKTIAQGIRIEEDSKGMRWEEKWQKIAYACPLCEGVIGTSKAMTERTKMGYQR